MCLYCFVCVQMGVRVGEHVYMYVRPRQVLVCSAVRADAPRSGSSATWGGMQHMHKSVRACMSTSVLTMPWACRRLLSRASAMGVELPVDLSGLAGEVLERLSVNQLQTLSKQLGAKLPVHYSIRVDRFLPVLVPLS